MTGFTSLLQKLPTQLDKMTGFTSLLQKSRAHFFITEVTHTLLRQIRLGVFDAAHHRRRRLNTGSGRITNIPSKQDSNGGPVIEQLIFLL